jgi:predicted nucleic acid-binding protein
LTEIGDGPVALDASIFIYFIERNPVYLAAVKPLFIAIDEGHLQGVTSSLTLLETLVAPLRAGNVVIAQQYERFLTNSRGLQLVPLTRALLRAAAQLRATTRLKTPDALQVAAALSAGCGAFVTNDDRIPPIPGLRVLRVDDHLETS